MKPLELTVYPRRGRETYVLPPPRLSLGSVAVDRFSEAKRLTDAELAAEAFREKGMMLAFRLSAAKSAGQGGKDLWTRSADKAEERLHTLYRFATHDHHDLEDQ